MHNSQPVHSSSMTVCITFGPPTMQSTGQALRHQGAADAPALVDDGQRRGPSTPMRRIERESGAPGDGRQSRDAFSATGRASVDVDALSAMACA